MANKKISELDAFQGNVQNDDLFEVVDVSDSSMAPTGTNKKVTWQEMKGDLNDTYLRLNGANGPITGNLAVTGDVDITGDYKKNGAPLNFDADYLKLDASNDPITGDLGVSGNIDITGEYLINGLPIKFDSIGWEIAELDDTPGAWQANKTELLRAYNTGKKVWVQPGVFELDDCLLQGQNQCVIWANDVTFLRAADPSIPVRDTEAMLQVGDGHKEIGLYGRITFNGNGSNAFSSDNFVLIRHSQPVTAIINFHELYFENNDSGHCFWINLQANIETPVLRYIRGVSLVMRDAMGSTHGCRFRTRCSEGVWIDKCYVIETGGDKPNKWNDVGYGSVRAAFSFELGQPSIPIGNTPLLRVGLIESHYAKYGVFSDIGVREIFIENVIVDDYLRNQDGSTPTIDIDSIVPIKMGAYVVTQDIAAKHHNYFGRVIYRRTNNILPVKKTGGGTGVVSVQAIQFPEESFRYRIDYLEIDGHSNLHDKGDSDGNESQWGHVGTIVFKGCDPANDLTLGGELVVDELILTDQFEAPGETRTRFVDIYDAVRINSFTALGGTSGKVTVYAAFTRYNNVNYGWWHKSDIRIFNGDFGDNCILNINSQRPAGPSSWAPTTSAQLGAQYLKLTLDNVVCNNLENGMSYDGSLIEAGDFGYFRERMQFIFRDCYLRDSEASVKALRPIMFDDAPTRMLDVNNPIAGTITFVDDLTDPNGVLVPGTKDLPTGEVIAPSILVDTKWFLKNEVDEGYNGYLENKRSQIIRADQEAPVSVNDDATKGELRATTDGVYLAVADNLWKKLSTSLDSFDNTGPAFFEDRFEDLSKWTIKGTVTATTPPAGTPPFRVKTAALCQDLNSELSTIFPAESEMFIQFYTCQVTNRIGYTGTTELFRVDDGATGNGIGWNGRQDSDTSSRIETFNSGRFTGTPYENNVTWWKLGFHFDNGYCKWYVNDVLFAEADRSSVITSITRFRLFASWNDPGLSKQIALFSASTKGFKNIDLPAPGPPLILPGFTFATLPNPVDIGTVVYITDASTVTYRGNAAGGGADVAKVFYDGSNWIYS